MSGGAKWLGSVVAFAIILLWLASVVFGWGSDSVVRDCDNLGMFYRDGRVYECRPAKQQPTSHGAGVAE